MTGKRMCAVLLLLCVLTSGRVAVADTIERVLSVGDTADQLPILGIKAYAIGGGGTIAARVQIAADETRQALLMRSGDGLWRRVAHVGEAAPGGGTFETLGRVAVGADSTVVFRADIRRTDATIAGALFARTADGLRRRLVIAGERTPVGDASRFTEVDVPASGESGEIVFRGTDDGDRKGLFRIGTSDARTLLMLAGDAIPGGGTFDTFGGPVIGADGSIVFFGSGTDNGSARKGIYRRAADGTVTALLTVGSGLAEGTVTVLQQPAAALDGTAVFRGTLNGLDAVTRTALFIADGAGVRVLAIEDGRGPGTSTYVQPQAPAVGRGGLVAFHAFLSVPLEALVVYSNVPAMLAAQDQATPFGGIYHSFGDPVIGPRARVLFSATLADGSVHLVRAVIGADDGAATLSVDCSLGASITAALAAVADQGTIEVRGRCAENIRIDDGRRLRLVGVRNGRRRASITSTDPSLPIIDVRPSAGALVLEGFDLRSQALAVQIAGFGHRVSDLTIDGGGVTLAGASHQVERLTVRRAGGVCLTVAAADSAIGQTRLQRCGSDGLAVSADGVSVDRVTVQNAKGRGLFIQSDDDQVLRNRSLGNRGAGLLLIGRGSTLTGNRVSGNRGGGLIVQGCNIDGGKNRAGRNRGGVNRDFEGCVP